MYILWMYLCVSEECQDVSEKQFILKSLSNILLPSHQRRFRLVSILEGTIKEVWGFRLEPRSFKFFGSTRAPFLRAFDWLLKKVHNTQLCWVESLKSRRMISKTFHGLSTHIANLGANRFYLNLFPFISMLLQNSLIAHASLAELS
jgi:hypothetical protein